MREEGAQQKVSVSNIAIYSFLSLIFLLLIILPIQKRLWYDELYTYYIAHAPSLSILIDQTRSVDLNPPLVYLLARWSEQLLGDNLFATRLPSVLGFLGGSYFLFRFLGRKIPLVWAGAAVLSFWSTQYFMYATEVRPYGELFFFCALALDSFDKARADSRRGFALAGIVIGMCGMLLSHVFAIFSILPLLASEGVRTLRRRKVDWLLWVVLLAPLALIVTYIPMFRRFDATLFPLTFQGGFRKMAVFFAKIAISLYRPFLFSAAVIAFLRWRSGERSFPRTPRLNSLVPEDLMLLSAFVFPPIAINLMLLRSHGSFFDRYCITSAATVCILTIVLLGHAGRFKILPGLCTSAIFAAFAIYGNFLQPVIANLSPRPARIQASAVRPELPFVIASGLTFLEVDHYEDPAFLRRVFYLTDRAGVIEYAHATFFDDFGKLKLVFPIRANVETFQKFSETHDHFLLLATIQHPEAWLLRKLTAEKGNVVKLGDFDFPYRDSTIYEIRLNGGIHH